MNDFLLRLSIQLPGFLLAIVCHEFAHAWMANRFGDSTAKDDGRLSFNPSAHIDPIGTVVFPLIGIALGGVAFGWARPVPIDVRRFNEIRRGIFWVSFAGPLANMLLTVVLAFVFVFFLVKVPSDFYLYSSIVQMLQQAVYINVVLAIFNLIPFPPLDGSKMVASFMDYNTVRKYEELANYSIIFFIAMMALNLWRYILTPGFMMADYLIAMFYRLMGL